MDSKQFHRRAWGLAAFLVIFLFFLGRELYSIQGIQGDYYYQLSQRRIAETETVEADRGDLLDCYGRVLVSNRTVYQVVFNTSLMGDDAQRNATLLTLINTAQETGVEWPDNLPISAHPPFRFTTDAPYVTTTTDEEGVTTTSLTRLGRLSVAMKWIEDPTKEKVVVETPQPEEPGLFDKLLGLFGMGGGDDTADQAQPDQPYALPTAEELLDKMLLSYKLATKGKETPIEYGDLTLPQARSVAGILYELGLRTNGIYWDQYVFAQDVDIDFISRVKELGLTGVVVEPTTVRQYNTTTAPHLLGRVALMNRSEWEYYNGLEAGYEMNDSVGKEGAELAFESYLRGSSGLRTVDRNTSGKIVDAQWAQEPQPGDNVVLTLDNDLQQMVENTLATHLPKLISKEVEGAACVILDVNSGAILSSASYPTFDLSTYSQDYNENSTNILKPFTNRALQETYAPGSTFKMVTAIAGLEEGIVTPTTQIRDEGRYTFYTKDGPMCWIYRQKGGTHGLENVTDAIKDSCNYYFFDVGRRVGIDLLVDYAGRFGLGQTTGVELRDEAGVMASPEYTESMGGTWFHGNTLSVAIGQESSQFTPIQLANYIATLVNGGTRYSTHLLKEVKSSDFSQVLYTYEPQVLSTIEIQDKNLDAIKLGMLQLTTEGSVAKYFQDLGVQVGAKTGSAQVSTQTESNAVFVCFAPYDDPQIAMAIVVEHGGSGSELGAMAADILKYYFSAQESREDILTENTLIQ